MTYRIETPADLQAARLALGLSCADLADWLRLQGRNAGDTVRAMECGRKAISGPVAVAIEQGLENQRWAGDKFHALQRQLAA